VTLKILIGRFSRNFFSTTAEGIDLKSGIYVPMNVFNMCCYCLRHLKNQNDHQRRSKFALKPYGKQHFHLLENSHFRIIYSVSIPYIGLVFTSHENRWRHFTDNKSYQIIENILKYKNGLKNNLMYKEIFN
jgi:hypothetical protein